MKKISKKSKKGFEMKEISKKEADSEPLRFLTSQMDNLNYLAQNFIDSEVLLEFLEVSNVHQEG